MAKTIIVECDCGEVNIIRNNEIDVTVTCKCGSHYKVRIREKEISIERTKQEPTCYTPSETK